MPEPCPRELAHAHVLLRLRPVLRALRRAVAARDATARKLHDAGAVATGISRGHADALLDQLVEMTESKQAIQEHARLRLDEILAERELRDQAAKLGARLPLDAMQDDLGLDDFELEVLVTCAGVELDTEVERVLAYIQDDLGRRLVSVDLACALTATSPGERLHRRAAVGRHGRLHRFGLLATTRRETSLRDELRVSPACLEVLLGEPVDLRLAFHDPADVEVVPPRCVPADRNLVAQVARALATGAVGAVGVTGPRPRVREVVMAIASDAGLALRRFPVPGAELASALATAAALRCALWLELDALGDVSRDEVLDRLLRTRVPLLLTGQDPWRPTELLLSRAYAEVPVGDVEHAQRVALWQAACPELGSDVAGRVAASYRFDGNEVQAAANLARTTAALQTNGHVVSASDCIGDACLAVARKHGERHTSLVVPRRSAADLVLAPELHARVLDLATYFRALPVVMEGWGFASRVSSAGIKALFTGEPGTGKTLAAEVVAHEVGLPMLKVDLARVVSKWIGETERNLDAVFTEAHDSHAVLFFDEAEALFGARGDVRHGTDRYANLEVSYLLQRLEAHAGVVILATNLRDKIDPAFMRRFHAVIGFPRPAERERRRIWQRVFTPRTPLAEEIDVGALARLDLTGAGIVGAAQTAALLAAHEGSALAMRHVVQGLVRQFQREARVLTKHDLGVHAVHAGIA